jgi:hypothetical protein
VDTRVICSFAPELITPESEERIKDNGMQYLTGLEWLWRRNLLAYDAFEAEHTHPLVQR